MRYFAVEVTRTVTERRKIVVCADDELLAHDAAVENAELEAATNPWASPVTAYSTANTVEISPPARVDVAV